MSEDSWYYAKSGQQFGPLPRAQLEQLISAGQVAPADFVWTNGMPQWQPAEQIFSAYVNQPALAPYDVPQYGTAPVYAGFWLRFVAWFIDWLTVTVVSLVLVGCIAGIAGGVMGVQGASHDAIEQTSRSLSPLVNVIAIVVGWLYYAVMESSAKQATLGKMALGLYVTDMNGHRISFGRATGRFFSKILSGLILLIGYMMAGWTQQKQALHDMMASTLVLRRQSY